MKLKTYSVCLLFGLMSCVAQAKLVADKTELGSGEKAVISVTFATPVRGDLYLAVNINNELYFFAEQGNSFSKAIVPWVRNSYFANDLNVLEIVNSGVPAGIYPLFEVVTLPGKNPLDFSNWVGGLNALSQLNIQLRKAAVTSPFNPITNQSCRAAVFSAKKSAEKETVTLEVNHDDDAATSEAQINCGVITPTPTATPTPTPVTPSATNGKRLFLAICSSCHGSNPDADQNDVLEGKNYLRIKDAINRNKGDRMGVLKGLVSDNDLKAIAEYLKLF